MRVVVALLALIGHARADEPSRLAFAVNTPLAWVNGLSIAGSAYIGVLDRHAIRINAARSNNWWEAPAALLFHADTEGLDEIKLTFGAGWVFYPRERFRGCSFELGAFHRDHDITETDPFSASERTVTDTQTYAAYGLVGYSVLIADHLLIATAIGGSLGYQYGTRTVHAENAMPMDSIEHISKAAPEAEAYLRFGYAF
jgi:hypothetical protein